MQNSFLPETFADNRKHNSLCLFLIAVLNGFCFNVFPIQNENEANLHGLIPLKAGDLFIVREMSDKEMFVGELCLGEMSKWGKWPAVWEMSVGELSVWEISWLGKCPVGEMSGWGNISVGEVSRLGKRPLRKCPVGEMSGHRNWPEGLRT